MARDIEVLRKSAEEILRQEGACVDVQCSACPLSVRESGAGCHAVGRSSLDRGYKETAVLLAKKWLEDNALEIHSLCHKCVAAPSCDSEPDICGKTIAESDPIDYSAHRTADQVSKSVHDMVNHPVHYTSHPSGIECIDITKHMDFCLGNAVKYLFRAGIKDPSKEGTIKDLKKAQWYIQCKIEMLEDKDE